MIRSIHDPSVSELFKTLRQTEYKTVDVNGTPLLIQTPFPSPTDWRDVWMYQMLVDRFNNPNDKPAAQWNGRNRYLFQGGTFNGIREKLPYLQELGVGAIWLSPVQKNCLYRPSYHGYAVQDFLSIDPRLSSDPVAAQKNPELAENELRALVDEIHARGMYVIFDIVLHHVGDVFAYDVDEGQGKAVAKAPFQNQAYTVQWRDDQGRPRPDWEDIADIPLDMPDAGVWPTELRDNKHFYRKGEGFEIETDFMSLKAIVTDGSTDARETLVRSYQYILGKFDVDGYRVDAFKHIDRGYGRIFCSAMREFAETIGKKNFFIFCEVFDNEDMIAQYIGRNTMTDNDDMKAADAALDFPLMFILPDVAKGIHPPSYLYDMFNHRRDVEKHILSTHGEASKFFVTFLDNHDQHRRVRYSPPEDPTAYDDQIEIALGLQFAIQGIPCLYYGTEQGMSGNGPDEEFVREALWGAPRPFDTSHPFYQFISRLATLRRTQAPLRYGRQYFRPISGDSQHFEIPTKAGYPVAFSRVLSNQEIIIIANPNLAEPWEGQVICDVVLNADKEPFDVLLTNKPLQHIKPKELHAGTYSDGRARYLSVSLLPGEIQFLSNRN